MIEKCRQIGKNSWNRWLYIICVLMLGLMDQRRGSATGDVQMMFGNLLGLVLAAMLIPSLDRKRFLCKLYGKRSIASTFCNQLSSAIIVSHYTQSKKFST